jgi:hypothetical protein
MTITEERLYAADVADMLGIALSTWYAYRARRQPEGNPVPPPDGVDVVDGHARPWWRYPTIKAWEQRRPSRSRPS